VGYRNYCDSRRERHGEHLKLDIDNGESRALPHALQLLMLVLWCGWRSP
jgi:hypothetical protein